MAPTKSACSPAAGGGAGAGSGARLSDSTRAFCSSENVALVLSVASRSLGDFLPSATSFAQAGRFLSKASAAYSGRAGGAAGAVGGRTSSTMPMFRSPGMSITSSATGSPRNTSGNTSRSAKARARIWRMRFGYCVHGPCLPNRPAVRASSMPKVRDCSGSPRRLTRQVAVWPSSVSITNSHSGLARTNAMTASPHSAGRPLMLAMFWSACSGLRPSSEPHCIAMRQLPGLPR